MDTINTEGVVEVGEVQTRVLREARVEDDYRNANIAGGVAAYEATARWAQEHLAAAGPFDDTRTLQELLQWLGDRIRIVQQPPTQET
jgi:hypothetical protein